MASIQEEAGKCELPFLVFILFKLWLYHMFAFALPTLLLSLFVSKDSQCVFKRGIEARRKP